jgi:hypothetical protein
MAAISFNGKLCAWSIPHAANCPRLASFRSTVASLDYKSAIAPLTSKRVRLTQMLCLFKLTAENSYRNGWFIGFSQIQIAKLFQTIGR